MMRYLLAAAIAVLALAAAADAGYRESFKKEFVYSPWAGGQQEEISACLECHTSKTMKPELQGIPQEWKMSWHFKNNVSCHDCHGGDQKDASMSMSHNRGFIGKPKNTEIPRFCGKCHIGILKVYNDSGHGKILAATGEGPNCVTCHGNHNIQKASIGIIKEKLCIQCHSYERAKLMKQALFLVEKKLEEIEADLQKLRSQGVDTREDEKTFFNTQAEFRTLFHAIDVALVKERASGFASRLSVIEAAIEDEYRELNFRGNFSAFLFLLFAALGITVFIISREDRQ